MNLPVKNRGGDSVLSVDIHQSQLQLRCQVLWFFCQQKHRGLIWANYNDQNAGLSPQMVVKSKGIHPKSPKHSGLGINNYTNLPSFIVFGGLLVCSLVGCEKNVKHDSRVTKRSCWQEVHVPQVAMGLVGAFHSFGLMVSHIYIYCIVYIYTYIIYNILYIQYIYIYSFLLQYCRWSRLMIIICVPGNPMTLVVFGVWPLFWGVDLQK